MHAICVDLGYGTGDACDLDLQHGGVGAKTSAKDSQVRTAGQRARHRLDGGDAGRHLGVKRITWQDRSRTSAT